MPDTSDQFTHTKEFQLRLLSYMLHNSNFQAVASDVLAREHFYDSELQWFFRTLSSTRHSKSTLQEELVSHAKEAKIDDALVTRFVEYYNLITTRVTPDEEKYINAKLGKFVKTQALKSAIMESWDLIKEGQWESIVDRVQEAASAGVDILDVGNFYFKDIETRVAQRANRLEEDTIMTGIDELDTLLNGGITAKQLGIIVGGTGRGKSLLMSFFTRMAVLAGKTVVYYTLELSEEVVADRFDSLFAHVKMRELKSSNDEVLGKLNPYAERFKNRLLIKEYPADSATVGTLRAHLRSLSSLGVVPDMVVVDYLDLVKPHRTYDSPTAEMDAITKALHGLSKELGVAIWTASQLNRSGLAMDNPDETAIAGALAKLFTVDLAIFIAQTAEEREDSEVRLIINKNRNGPAGRFIKIHTDFEYMQFYRPNLEIQTPDIPKDTLVGQEHEQAEQADLLEDSCEGDVLLLQ